VHFFVACAIAFVIQGVQPDLASEDHHLGRLLNHRRHWTGWPAEFRLRRDDDIAPQQVTRLKRRGDAGQSEVTSPKFYGSIFLRGPLPGWDPLDGAPGNDISKCVGVLMPGPAWESLGKGPGPPGFVARGRPAPTTAGNSLAPRARGSEE